ncbi:hypothetical protein DL771_001473 [Monosporascus sp. 5C6A]|nr:hypothetical protein DL771_001473 [Monosporascus sp. 5C6A]
MLNKLTAVPTDTLSKIRYLRVRGDMLTLTWPDHEYIVPLASAFKLLPGLKLNTLTVLRGHVDLTSYDSLSVLIADGDGWKELRYISHSSSLLGYGAPDDPIIPFDLNDPSIPQDPSIPRDPYDPIASWDPNWWPPNYLRKPQPEFWRGVLTSRDGVSSNPSVAIYRSPKNGPVGRVIREDSRLLFEQSDTTGFGLEEDASLCAGPERFKELLIVARRGHGVDYQVKKDSPFIWRDIRRACPGMTWREIKSKHIDMRSKSGGGSDSDSDSEDPFADAFTDVDRWHDVDEYVWTPLHFGLSDLL